MEDLRLSMVSMSSQVGDQEGNLRKILSLMDRENGSDIICFPELSLTGYRIPDSASYTLTLDSPAIGAVIDKTQELGNCVCFGFVEEGPYITQVLAEDGRIVGRYRKTHLGERESACMLRGEELPVFRTRRAVVGIQVCWESHFPEITCTYALKGAELVLFPHASGLSGDRRKDLWDLTLSARAYDNTVFAGACNQFSPGSERFAGGGASIYGTRGEILAEDYSGEAVVTADLGASDIERLRKAEYGNMRDLYYLIRRRPELYFR